MLETSILIGWALCLWALCLADQYWYSLVEQRNLLLGNRNTWSICGKSRPALKLHLVAWHDLLYALHIFKLYQGQEEIWMLVRQEYVFSEYVSKWLHVSKYWFHYPNIYWFHYLNIYSYQVLCIWLTWSFVWCPVIFALLNQLTKLPWYWVGVLNCKYWMDRDISLEFLDWNVSCMGKA